MIHKLSLIAMGAGDPSPPASDAPESQDDCSEHEGIYLDQLFDNAQLGIAMAENDGTVIRVNPEFTAIFGYTAEECIGRNIDSLVADREHLEDAVAVTQSVAAGRKQVFEADRRAKDGTFKKVAVMASPIVMNGDQVAVYAFYRDITDQRRAEAELIKAKKLEATGKLAGGIAHDFNNLLSVVLGNVELALLDTPAGSPAIRALAVAKDACIKAHELTSKFITFSTGGQPITQPVDIGLLIRKVAETVFSGTAITCRFTLPEHAVLVQVDPVQFQHVLEEVMKNALESMTEGGVVEIGVSSKLREACRELQFLENRPYVCVSISDNGIGIPTDSLPKVFDPYFSSKPTAFRKGLGMGLAVAHSIVTQHNGRFHIDSEYRKGTTVEIYIPAEEKFEPQVDQRI